MKFLKMSEVIARVGLNKATIYRMMKAGEFPRSIQISEIRVAWVESEVIDWMERKIAAARDTQQLAA